ncbi:ABC transporter ATP-binding protein [Hathewaya limosa]|uniref:ABC-type multidrug transport system ATPase subunit n=1 Tax=Hathewaya limosa TaxID=1536 RepID=A0ABU0JTZ7_HATLI|nr:ATP-binding cassette domain-containing protein [Hathewaya limosa]AWZ47528.1 ABC transporter ATP-binding protein [Clostridiaceae bacterium 14S0207]MDQ0480577.1 ABC-type multidrug transport system ATPase subunit [Hathewaya limosa]
MSNIVEVKNLTKTLSRRMVLDNISFNIKKGSIVGFLGPNGAGKTTTIRALTGLIGVKGEIKINGILIKNRILAMKEVGAIVENPIFFSYMTAYENLMALIILDKELKKCDYKERIEEVIDIVGLTGREYEKVKNYSLGMKQRLGIAQALLNKPKFLILDEPTNGLDPIGIKDLRKLILKLNIENGITFFISSHLLDELQKISTDYIIIREGKILQQGNKKQILNEYGEESLEEAFIKIIGGGN